MQKIRHRDFIRLPGVLACTRVFCSSARNHRQQEMGRILPVVGNGLLFGEQFGVHAEGLSAVRVAIEAQEISFTGRQPSFLGRKMLAASSTLSRTGILTSGSKTKDVRTSWANKAWD